MNGGNGGSEENTDDSGAETADGPADRGDPDGKRRERTAAGARRDEEGDRPETPADRPRPPRTDQSDFSPDDRSGPRPPSGEQYPPGSSPDPPPQGPPPNQPPQDQQSVVSLRERAPDHPPQGPTSGRFARAPVRSVFSVRRGGGRGGRTPLSRIRRARTGQSVGPPEQADGDPVQEAYSGRVDLYDIATWEVRSRLDRFAVSMYRGLRKGRTALLVGAALLLFLVQGAVAVASIAEEPFIGVLALSSMVPAFLVAGYLWYGDPTRREPFVTLAVTFLLSMLFAGFAGVINSTVGPAFEAVGVAGTVVFFFLVVGPIEEFVKWLAIRVYAYRSDTFQTVIDGVVYGAAAGVGFAAIENLIYIVTVYIEAGETAGIVATEEATAVAVQRFLVGPGHVVFSAWAGFYLGLAKFNAENRGPIVVKGLLIAAFIHALYNVSVTVLPGFLPGVAVLGYILLYDGFWLLVLYRKIRAYRELYQARYRSRWAAGQR